MKKLESYSFLKANIEKCKIAWIGLSKYKTDKPVKCKLVSLVYDTVKNLGVYFSYDRNTSENKSFLNIVDDDGTVTNIWRQRWVCLWLTRHTLLNRQLSL